MENQTSFDLSAAIQNWRRYLAQSAAFRGADLDELEAHLRDAIPALQAAGLSSEESFLIASRRIGTRHALESEFGKINTTHARLDRPLLADLRLAMVSMILALVGVWVAIDTARRQATSSLAVEPWIVFPGIFGVFLLAIAILGGIGYAALRVVSKSGSERLANIRTWSPERQSPRN